LSAGEFEAVLSEMVVAVHLLAPRGFAGAKAFLVTFAVTGKSNCPPRQERQTKSFLLLCKSSISLRHERQTDRFRLLL
jgi:hypothetical protein